MGEFLACSEDVAPFAIENLDISSTRRLYLAVTCPGDASVHGGNWKNFTHFLRNVQLGS